MESPLLERIEELPAPKAQCIKPRAFLLVSAVGGLAFFLYHRIQSPLTSVGGKVTPSFLDAASSQAIYVAVGTPGAPCPSGYLPVVDEAECKNEVMDTLTAEGWLINNAFDTDNLDARVAGCYLNGAGSATYNGHPGNGRVTFNRDLDTTSATSDSGRHICKAAYVAVGTPGAPCPSRYLPVVDEAECKNEVMDTLTAGGSVINNAFDTDNLDARVAGCYLNGAGSATYNGHPGNGRVTFNRDLDSTSATSDSGRHICKR